MNLCKYQNIFGAPNTGIHSIRIFNIAVVDLLLTIFLAKLISNITKSVFIFIFIMLIIISIFIHKLFCVKTTLTKLVFGNNL